MAVRRDNIQIVVDIEAKQGVRAYQKLLDQTREVNNEMRRLKRQGKENTAEFKDLEKQAAKLNNELKGLGGAGANMAQLITRSRQLNRELKSLVPGTERFIQVTQELRGVNTRLKDIRNETRGVNQELQQMQILGVKVPPAFGKIANGVNLVKGAFRAFLALEIVNQLFQLFQGADQLTQQFVKLRGTVQQFTQASGEGLDEYTTRVNAISTTFGQDTNEVLQAANALTKQLTGDFSESLRLIEQGFASGANANEQFLDQLKEYPAFFREAGLSGEQFISVIGQSTREGIFSDKGVDLIKEFTLRVRELPKATQEALNRIGIDSERIRKEIDENGIGGAFRLVQERLNQLGDDAPEVGQVLADVFAAPGEDAGIQFIKNLDLTDEALNNLVATGGEYTAQMQRQLQANQDLAEAQNDIAKRFTDTSNSLNVYITQAKTFLLRVAGDILQFFEQLPATASGVQAAFKQIMTNISAFFQSTAIDLKATLKQVEKLNPFGKTTEQLDAEIAALRSRQADINDAAGNVIEAYNKAFIDALEDTETRKKVSEALMPKPSTQAIEQLADDTVERYKKAVEENAKKKKAPDIQFEKVDAIDVGEEDVGGFDDQFLGANIEDLLKNRFLKALITEQEYNEQRYQMQQDAFNQRLELLRQQFGEESANYIELENKKLEAQRDYEQQRVELTKRTEQARQELQQASLSATSEFVGGIIELLKAEQGERKKNSLALKAFSAGKVIIDTEEAIMAIIKNAEANPANILFPGAAKIIAGLKIAGVLARSTAALSKIGSANFYGGGFTGDQPIMRDNQGRGIVGGVHANEWVAPEWMNRHPVYGQAIGWLENMRQRGFQEGGFTTVNTTPSIPPAAQAAPAAAGFDAETIMTQILESNMRVVRAIEKKQFAVNTGQLRDALEDDYRLDDKAKF